MTEQSFWEVVVALVIMQSGVSAWCINQTSTLKRRMRRAESNIHELYRHPR